MGRPKTPAARAALAIEADILDRRGLKWELRQCDPDVRKEIRATWTGIVAAATIEACAEAEPRVHAEGAAAERRRIVALLRAEADRRRADLVGVDEDTHEFVYESAVRDALLAAVGRIEGGETT